MVRARDIRWRRWAAGFAGFVVAYKSADFLLRRIFRIASSEMQARGKRRGLPAEPGGTAQERLTACRRLRSRFWPSWS